MVYTVLGGILFLAACSPNPPSVIPYEAVPAAGDPTRGEELFARSERVIPSCVTCHVQDPAGSPVLDATYPELAASRIEGMDAHEYTFYSIAEPGGYIVEGYGNAMYNRYDDNLNPQDIADLIAYLLSL